MLNLVLETNVSSEYLYSKGAIIFFGRGGEGSQIYKKSESIKLRPPDYGNKIFMAPVTVTPYHLNMLKLYWNPSFWTK